MLQRSDQIACKRMTQYSTSSKTFFRLQQPQHSQLERSIAFPNVQACSSTNSERITERNFEERRSEHWTSEASEHSAIVNLATLYSVFRCMLLRLAWVFEYMDSSTVAI